MGLRSIARCVEGVVVGLRSIVHCILYYTYNYSYLSNKYKLPIKLKKIKLKFQDRYLPSIIKAKKELNLKLEYTNYRAVDEVINRLKNN